MQPDPMRLIVTVSPLVLPFVGGVVHVNPDPRDTVGDPGITKPSANVTEIVSASVRAVAGVNETVQVVVAPATIDAPEKVTAVTDAAAAGKLDRTAVSVPIRSPRADPTATRRVHVPAPLPSPARRYRFLTWFMPAISIAYLRPTGSGGAPPPAAHQRRVNSNEAAG